jgi:hypothetical protein
MQVHNVWPKDTKKDNPEWSRLVRRRPFNAKPKQRFSIECKAKKISREKRARELGWTEKSEAVRRQRGKLALSEINAKKNPALALECTFLDRREANG